MASFLGLKFGESKSQSKTSEADVSDLADSPTPVVPFDEQGAAISQMLAATAPTPAQGGNARKVTKGTSYTAAGLEPPVLESEVGSAQPAVIRELVPELLTPFQRVITYGSMMNDAGCDVSIRVSKTPVLGAEFYMQPYSDDPQDQEIAEFIWSNLAEGMSAPFLNALDDILGMYTDGYSVLEKVYEEREWSPHRKGGNTRVYTMLKKLGVRPASTAKSIDYDDNGGPVQFVQNAIRADGTPQEVPLPINKIMIFTFSRRGGDLTGKSLLRTAYAHWYYKTHFYKIDAVQKERHSLGVPRGKLLPGYNNNDKTILRVMLRNLRTNEEAFFIQTPNVEIDFAKVEGQLVDVLSSATHHNTMILLNVMAQFLTLGLEQSGGGRATAGNQSDLFMKALRYVANYIVQQINMYLIPELVVWNYPTTNFPKLAVRNLGEARDLQMLGSALANLVAQDVVQMDDDTEQWVRNVFDMPLRTTPRTEVQPTPTTTDTTQSQNGSTPAKGNVKRGSGFKGKPQNAPE